MGTTKVYVRGLRDRLYAYMMHRDPSGRRRQRGIGFITGDEAETVRAGGTVARLEQLLLEKEQEVRSEHSKPVEDCDAVLSTEQHEAAEDRSTRPHVDPSKLPQMEDIVEAYQLNYRGVLGALGALQLRCPHYQDSIYDIAEELVCGFERLQLLFPHRLGNVDPTIGRWPVEDPPPPECIER